MRGHWFSTESATGTCAAVPPESGSSPDFSKALLCNARQRGDSNPLRAEPNGLLVHHLNHSVTLSCRAGSPVSAIGMPECVRLLKTRVTVIVALGRLDGLVRSGTRGCLGEGQRQAPCGDDERPEEIVEATVLRPRPPMGPSSED